MTATTPTRPGPLGVWWLAARPKTLPVAVAPVLVGTALASCLGMVDTDSGGQGRCVWALDGGERIFSTLNGALVPAGAESGTAQGVFVGGTGRFKTITGQYEFDWVAQPVAEAGGFRMQTVRMSGVWQAP